MIDTFSVLSGVGAALSALIALVAMSHSRTAARAAREQAAMARSANGFAREARCSEAVLQFTGRYAQLIGNGARFGCEAWEYQFWALYALEYFFYERRWMPRFIFELWMVELASMYQSDEVRASHLKYLQPYAERGEAMATFYARLLQVAESSCDDRDLRSREIVHLVRTIRRVDEALD